MTPVFKVIPPSAFQSATVTDMAREPNSTARSIPGCLFNTFRFASRDLSLSPSFIPSHGDGYRLCEPVDEATRKRLTK